MTVSEVIDIATQDPTPTLFTIILAALKQFMFYAILQTTVFGWFEICRYLMIRYHKKRDTYSYQRYKHWRELQRDIKLARRFDQLHSRLREEYYNLF
jgi:hypothetical protein